MCGISGIIYSNIFKIDHDEIKKMNDLIAHRGPDDEGFYYGANFVFGHRRLSIVDLTSAGHQPMEYMGRYVIIHNGEVYNYLEIRNDLRERGYSFKSNTDTEVILAAYDKWGDDCVSHFNGMWAFAIFDNERKTIFCSRDRFGIKPFYYAKVNGKFAFASEIKQLLVLQKNVYVNKRMLIDYLLSGLTDHTNETFFNDILSLPGGHNLTYDLESHSYIINKYYNNICDEFPNANEIDCIKIYKNEFVRSINFRLRSDVPVGTCLSGGIDSSSIAGIAADRYTMESGKQFKGIHAKSSEAKTDESVYAEIVAQAKNIDLYTIMPTPEEFKEVLDDAFYTQEEPFSSPSVIMQYFVMKKAKELGCIVMLDGQGGDETLLGYAWYYPAYLLSFTPFKSVIALFQSIIHSSLSLKELIAYLFYFPSYKIRRWRQRNKCCFLKDELFNDFCWLKKHSKGYYSISELQKIEIYHTQLPHLLKCEDRNSMRHSIEARLPFLDYRLLEIALSINAHYKMKKGWTKYILRKALEGILPYEILWRKSKLGFAAPDKTWINSISQEINQVISGSHIIKAISKKPIDLKTLEMGMSWRLYSIAKWENIYDVKIG